MPAGDATQLIHSKAEIFSAFIKKLLLFYLIYSIGYFNLSTLLLPAVIILIVLSEQWREEKLNKLQIARAISLGQEQEIVLNTLKELPDWVKFSEMEKVEWLNSMFKQLWYVINQYVEDLAPKVLEPAIQAYISDFKFNDVKLGATPLHIKYIKVHDNNTRKIEMDLQINYTSDCQITFQTFKFAGGIKNIQVKGLLRVVLRPLMSTIPFFGGLQAYFMAPPHVDFELMKLTQIFDVPVIKTKIKNTVMQVINSMLLYPNAYSINLSSGINVTKLAAFHARGILRVHIVEAKNLMNKDLIGKSDPYVVLRIGSIEAKTPVIENCLNPKWDYWHDFDIEPNSVLNVEVWDKDDGVKDDALGHGKIDISSLPELGLREMELTLDGVEKGTLYLRLMWLSLSSNFDDLEETLKETQLLNPYLHTAIFMIFVESALQLPLLSKTSPNPYCQLEIEGIVKQTDIEKDTCDPMWEQTFTYLLKDPKSAILTMRIFDNETGNKLGELSKKIDDLRNESKMFMKKRAFFCDEPNLEVSICCSMKLRILKNLEVQKDCDNNNETKKLKKMLSREESLRSAASSLEFNIGNDITNYIDDDIISDIGQIKLTLQYSQQRQKILINVNELNIFKAYGSYNPYVKILLQVDKQKTLKKTQIIRNASNPTSFNENFDFLLSSQDLNNSCFLLEVKIDGTLRNKFLGQTVIALTQYDNMIEPFTDWFNLHSAKELLVYRLIK